MIAPTVKDDMGAVIEEYAEPIEPVEFKRLLSIYRENDRILPRALEIVKTYGAQNEAYMSRSAEKWVRGLCFNELGVCS